MVLRFKLRTKVEIVSATLFLIILTAISVTSVTRTISDSGDNSYTFIRNTNGNYWDATGGNIQNAINDLGVNGGSVYLPAGTIIASSMIYMKNNTKLIGSGVGVTTITANNYLGMSLVRANQVRNVTISDLTIDGNNVMGDLIYLKAVSDSSVQNVYLLDSTSNGIYTSEGCERCFFDNIRVTGINTDSFEGFAFAEVYNSTFNNLMVWNAWMGVDFHNIKNCVISNIEIFNCSYAVKFFGEGDYSTDNLVTNINCHDLRPDTGMGGFWIKNNKRSSFTNIHIRDTYGIVIDHSDDINLVNFYIENAADVGLDIDNDIGSNYRININNGIIKNANSDGLKITGAYDVSITNCQIFDSGNYNLIDSSSNIKISSSSFTDGSSYGLIVTDSRYLSISNSEFTGNALDGIDFTLGGGSSNYTITACTFYGNALAIDCHNTNDDYIIITNNICYGDAIDDHYKTKGIVTKNIGDDI
jgi:hypothetical protein